MRFGLFHECRNIFFLFSVARNFRVMYERVDPFDRSDVSFSRVNSYNVGFGIANDFHGRDDTVDFSSIFTGDDSVLEVALLEGQDERHLRGKVKWIAKDCSTSLKFR